jgi:dihydroanticapsin dehydrogenase
MAPYCSSKGAVLMLTKALAVDLADQGTRVNCVCPSVVDTPMSRADLGLEDAGFAEAPFPVQSATDVANLVAFLASPVSRPVNATHLLADFGDTARSSFQTKAGPQGGAHPLSPLQLCNPRREASRTGVARGGCKRPA